MAVINLRDGANLKSHALGSKPSKVMVVLFEYIVPYGIAWGGGLTLLYLVYRGLTCHH